MLTCEFGFAALLFVASSHRKDGDTLLFRKIHVMWRWRTTVVGSLSLILQGSRGLTSLPNNFIVGNRRSMASMRCLHCHSHIIEFDGGARGNPGVGGYGYAVYRAGAAAEGRYPPPTEFLYGYGYLGSKCTNNRAEYTGLLEGLQALRESGEAVTKLLIKGDSLLVVNQILGKWRCKNEGLRPLNRQCLALLTSHFPNREVQWIPRESNKRADGLSNQAMDTRGKEKVDLDGARCESERERELERDGSFKQEHAEASGDGAGNQDSSELLFAVPSPWSDLVSSANLASAKISLSERLRESGLGVDDGLQPPVKDVFKALELVGGPQDVRVVILGNKPIPDLQSTGLAFAAGGGTNFEGRMPPALSTMTKVLGGRQGEFDVTLESWARQGVLLLNTCLTCQRDEKSHEKIWEATTTDLLASLISYRNERRDLPPLVFLLWGKQSMTACKRAGLEKSRHLKICSSNPHPASCKRKFGEHPAFFIADGDGVSGEKATDNCFVRCNNMLRDIQPEEKGIDWTNTNA